MTLTSRGCHWLHPLYASRGVSFIHSYRQQGSHRGGCRQVLTHTASQMASLGGSPQSPRSSVGHTDAELEREMVDLKAEAGRLQHRLAEIERRSGPACF